MSKATVPIFTGDASRHPWPQSLPAYARSLLKIKVPVSVTLAVAKQSISDILELVPGAIVQFEKTCDEPLTLAVGDHCVAEGETVKVGDKFGLRITSMVMPGERFHRVVGRTPPPGDGPENAREERGQTGSS